MSISILEITFIRYHQSNKKLKEGDLGYFVGLHMLQS